MYVLQADTFTCGAVALHAVLDTLGASYSVATLARMCKTSPIHGTSEEAVMKTLGTLDHPYREIEESHPGFALVTLRGFVAQGAAALLAADADTHWIAVVGMSGARFIVHDPATGTESYSDKDLITRWRKEKSKLPYYGVCVLGRR
jgi:ABC-type bacteriocin/lantibiotic exporter with double-glycine peptidase domain